MWRLIHVDPHYVTFFMPLFCNYNFEVADIFLKKCLHSWPKAVYFQNEMIVVVSVKKLLTLSETCSITRCTYSRLWRWWNSSHSLYSSYLRPLKYSGILRCVVWWIVPKIVKDSIALVFRTKAALLWRRMHVWKCLSKDIARHPVKTSLWKAAMTISNLAVFLLIF
jgi:hypothetical protein